MVVACSAIQIPRSKTNTAPGKFLMPRGADQADSQRMQKPLWQRGAGELPRVCVKEFEPNSADIQSKADECFLHPMLPFMDSCA